MPFSLSYTGHAIKRMFERSISDNDVLGVLTSGETIEEYPDDVPIPSRLVIGWINRRCLHVVVADDADAQITVVVTVYEPDSQRWDPPDFRQRRPLL
jgi:hypothetical protein